MSSLETLKRTPLYECHLALQGKMVDFGGWSLPVYYSAIIAEHQWTRSESSFFDVSHLGEIRVKGPGSFEFLQQRLTNDLNRLTAGRAQYHLICNEQGGVMDDILVYQGGKEDYYLVVNASNIEKDEEALRKYSPDAVQIENVSEETACVAVQGPKAGERLEKLFGLSLLSMPAYSFKEDKIGGQPIWISRTGYTGEDGFEMFTSPDRVVPIWNKLQSAKDLNLRPAGLGARNTLRLEAGNVLYGHELDETTTPLEAGLGFAVSFKKGGFVGRDQMLVQKEKGLRRHLVGFKMLDRSVARDGYAVYAGARKIGSVTSGSYGPTVMANIGMAYVDAGFETVDTRIEIEIHSRKVPALVVAKPFVDIKHV